MRLENGQEVPTNLLYPNTDDQYSSSETTKDETKGEVGEEMKVGGNYVDHFWSSAIDPSSKRTYYFNTRLAKF